MIRYNYEAEFNAEMEAYSKQRRRGAALELAAWAVKIFALMFCAAIFAEAFVGFFTTEF